MAGGASSRFTLRVIDRGLNQLEKTLRSLADSKSYVKAGVLEGKKTSRKADLESGGDTPSNIELALIHEFGTDSIPERPWIRAAFEKNRAGYIRDLRALLAQVYAGRMTIERALGLMGAKMAADIKGYVTQGPPIPPPNAPATLKAKIAKGDWRREEKAQRAQKGKPVREGPDLPPRTLVDTGQMVNSVSWAVVLSGFNDGGRPKD